MFDVAYIRNFECFNEAYIRNLIKVDTAVYDSNVERKEEINQKISELLNKNL